MARSIDSVAARAVIQRAFVLAESEIGLPKEWIDRATKISAATSKTLTVAYATGLLAKATDSKADPLSIKAKGDRAYSARSLAHGVWVPAAAELGIDLRATGREPLNNQPFFRYERMDAIDRARNPKDIAYLVECLQRVDELSEDDAFLAVAAFIRVRRQAASRVSSIDLSGASMGFLDLVLTAEAFIQSKPEGGRRGQALVSAAFDLVFENVRSIRVNDPSRHFPGDVQVMDGDNATLSAEVRQKPVPEREILGFSAKLAEFNVARGMVVLLSEKQGPLDSMKIQRACYENNGVLMEIVPSVGDLLTGVLVWGDRSVHDLLAMIPERMGIRLKEIDAEPESIVEWGSHFGLKPTPAAPPSQ